MLGIGIGVGMGIDGSGGGVPANGELIDDNGFDFELIDDNGDFMLIEG